MRLHPKQLAPDGTDLNCRLFFSSSLWQPYGSYGYNDSEGTSSTSSTSYQQKLRLTTPSIPAGYYEIFFQAAVRNNALDWAALCRVQVDDTINVTPDDPDATMHSEQDVSTNQRHPFHGSKRVLLTSGTHNIDLDYKSESILFIAYISEARLFFRDAPITQVTSSLDKCQLKLKQLAKAGAVDDQELRWDGDNYAPFGYIQQAESLSTSTTTSATYQEKLKLTTPSTMPYGTYMIFWHFTWYRTSESGDAGFRVHFDDTSVLQEWEQEPQDPSVNQDNVISGFRRFSNISGVHTIDIDYREVTGGSTVGIMDAWLIIQQVDVGA